MNKGIANWVAGIGTGLALGAMAFENVYTYKELCHGQVNQNPHVEVAHGLTVVSGCTGVASGFTGISGFNNFK